jgi:hypothetical protein
VAKYTENFTVQTGPHEDPSSASEFEYWLYVDTDNKVTFEVSTDGTTVETQLKANSFGAIGTATWFNVVAWHDTGNTLGLAVNLTSDTVSHTNGIRVGSAPLTIGGLSGGGFATMDGRVDHTMYYTRTLTDIEKAQHYNDGNANQYTEGFGNFIWGSFDFGASNIRWLTVAAGTGLYASSDLGVNFTEIGTSQTSTWNHFERSKNVLVVTTSNYDPPVIWDGSGGSFVSLLNTSAPSCKYAINHQGFLILLNSSERKRIFSYEDANTQLTGDWADSFDLPSSADDEITGAFSLRKTLYVSTKYKLFRVSYVGGNPDWSFLELKNWGYVPRTIQKITIPEIGEVAVGMDHNRRLRLFDGADDKIISDNVEANNMMSEFALSKVSFAGSGLLESHSVLDDKEQVYKLNLVVGDNSTQTSHMLNLDARTLAFYPDDNRPFQTMVMAESAGERFLVAGDRSGNVVLMNSGNLDMGTTAIDEHYDTRFIFEKSPSQVSKTHKADFYFTPTSSNTLFIQNRQDFSGNYKTNKIFQINDTGTLLQHKVSVDTPVTQNTIQYRLTSSSNTANPWKLNRFDFFVSGKGIGGTR